MGQGNSTHTPGLALWSTLTHEQRKSFDASWRDLVGTRSSVPIDEMVNLLKATGFDQEKASQMAKAFDEDGDGTVETTEYQAFMASAGTVEDRLRSAFATLDVDNDGSLTREELKARIATVLPKGAAVPSDEVINKLFDSVDADGSGSIDIDEFITGFSASPEVTQLLRASC